MVDAAGRKPPELALPGGRAVEPVCLLARHGRRAWRYDFELPADAAASYRLDGAEIPVDTTCSARHRIAYVSCNGQEREDSSRALQERNVMWRRLVAEHDARPFGLILHGGDQLYADEVLEAHPTLSQWSRSTLEDRARYEFTPDVEEAAECFYLERYEELLRQPELAWLSARIPALMIWDDHDIFDGWGSCPEPILDSPVGRGLFSVARRMFLLFQDGAVEEVARACQASSRGPAVRGAVRFPHLTTVIPDLRSERRPTRIMGPASWAAFERSVAAACPRDRILVLSSVPVLGPRLSWIEMLLAAVPGAQNLEDDLRDQWQSRTHRAEWRRFLETLERRTVEGDNGITILSGEIHLATRAEMSFRNGTILHQFVSSGIAHPPPPALYTRALGWLASLGESPLPGQPIRMRPLPGQPRIYTAERNYLVLERDGAQWTAEWELEHSGRTPALRL